MNDPISCHNIRLFDHSDTCGRLDLRPLTHSLSIGCQLVQLSGCHLRWVESCIFLPAEALRVDNLWHNVSGQDGCQKVLIGKDCAKSVRWDLGKGVIGWSKNSDAV